MLVNIDCTAIQPLARFVTEIQDFPSKTSSVVMERGAKVRELQNCSSKFFQGL
jgi:hypothetical protein